MDKKILDELAKISVATVTMQLLKRGIRNISMTGVRPLNDPLKRLVGPAYTLRYVPLREDLSTPEVLGKPDYPPLPALPPKTKPLSEDYKRIQKERKKINAKRKRERKKKIHGKVQERHPELEITLEHADAVGMLMYAQGQRPTLGLEPISEKS